MLAQQSHSENNGSLLQTENMWWQGGVAILQPVAELKASKVFIYEIYESVSVTGRREIC